MPYIIELRPDARDQLKKLSKPVAQRILKRIKWLADHFDDVPHEALKGEFKGLYKLRIGDYRVIYSFATQTRLLTIHLIDHRRQIYEQR